MFWGVPRTFVPQNFADRAGYSPAMNVSTTTAEQTAAARLHASPIVEEAIDRVIDEMRKAQARLNAVRPALSDEMASQYRDLLARASEVRGKSKLFFDYHGSGLGNGPFVELADGSVKLDLICGIGPMFFGHSDPELTRIAMRAAMSDIIIQGNLQMNEDSTQFSQVLIDEASRCSRLAHVFLTNSGCMANESALKICYQKHAPAGRVIAFENCFTGRSVTMSQIGDNAGNRVGIPLSTLVDYLPFYDAERGEASTREILARLDTLIERYPGQHACFIFELVQGEGGFNPAPREFFTALMERCRKAGIAVWVDEVQTFGRTGEMFAFDLLKLGEYVDVCTIGKLSQVCACLYSKEYNPKPGLLSGTFIGSTVAIQAGLYILNRLRRGKYFGSSGAIAHHHKRFVAGIEDIASRRPEWFGPILDRNGRAMKNLKVAGGLGGMMRFTPFGGRKEPVNAFMYNLYDEGVLSFYCGHGPYHIRFLPPLGVMKLEHWDAAFEVVERALDRTADEIGRKEAQKAQK